MSLLTTFSGAKHCVLPMAEEAQIDGSASGRDGSRLSDTSATGPCGLDPACCVLRITEIARMGSQTTCLPNHVVEILCHSWRVVRTGDGKPLHELRSTNTQHCCAHVNGMGQCAVPVCQGWRDTYRLRWRQTEDRVESGVTRLNRHKPGAPGFDDLVVELRSELAVDELTPKLDELCILCLLYFRQAQLVRCLSKVHGTDAYGPGSKGGYDCSRDGQCLVWGYSGRPASRHQKASCEAYHDHDAQVYAVEKPFHGYLNPLGALDGGILSDGSQVTSAKSLGRAR